MPTARARAEAPGAVPPVLGRRDVFLLGVLSAIGPVGVDIYLPAFPRIARDLGTDIGTVQLSMAAYFLALALGQLPYGALSDRFGRRPPIIAGLCVFVIGSVCCALSASAGWLIAGRFVQGLGICAILSVSRAMIRDRQSGGDAAHTAARILLVVSVSPMLAPLGGSAIIAVGDWRDIFWVMSVLSLGVLAFAARFLPETGQRRGRGKRMLATSLHLLRDPRFLAPTLLLASAQGGASIYLAGSSNLYLLTYGLAPVIYSLAFALNAGGMIGAAQLNRRLIGRLGLRTLPLLGTVLGFLAVSAFALARLAGSESLPVLFASFFMLFTAYGFVMGPSAVLALEEHKEIAGTASGLQGTVQFAVGAGAVTLVGQLGEGDPAVMIAVLFACHAMALCAALYCRFSPRLATA